MPAFRLFDYLRGLVVLLSVTAASLAAQAQGLSALLLTRATGAGNALITATAAAANGDVYVAGVFSGSMELGTHQLYSTGSNDLFVARYQASTGTVLWVQQFGSNSDEYITALAATNTTVYVGGSFSGQNLSFGSHTLSNASPIGVRGSDGFVVRLSDTGPQATVDWAYSLSGPDYERVTALAVAGTTVYVGGVFNSTTATFGSVSISNSQPPGPPVPTTDGVVLALRDQGPTASVGWSRFVTGGGNEVITQLAARGTRLYVGGTYVGISAQPSYFNGSTLRTVAHTSSFVGCLRDTTQAAMTLGIAVLPGDDQNRLTSLALAPGGVYVGGHFMGPTLPIGPDELRNAGTADGYLAYLADTGLALQWRWGRAIAGAGIDYLQALATDGQSLYAAGYFYSPTLTLGSLTLRNAAPAPGTAATVFVARLTPAGDFVEARQTGGEGLALAHSAAIAGQSLYLGGELMGRTTFGSQVVWGPSSNTSGFLASLAVLPLGTPPTATLPGLALWPNPAQGRAALRLPAGHGASPFSISLVDALGRVVWRRPAAPSDAGQTIRLDLTGLAPGVYALRVQQGAAQAVQRLVVQ